MDYKILKDVMRKDVQYRRSFLLKVEPVEDCPCNDHQNFDISEIEDVILSNLSDSSILESVVPVTPNVFFICLKSTLLRDTFILENKDRLFINKEVELPCENGGSACPEQREKQENGIEDDNNDDIRAEISIENTETAKVIVQTQKKFRCQILPGFPVSSIKFSYIFEGKGNDAKIDSFVKRVTGSKGGDYNIIRQKTLKGTFTGALLVHFINEDSKNHALRSLKQLKVSYNGNEVKYEEFKIED